MLELKGVTKQYGNKVVLSHLDLRFEPQRTYVLIGPSGCGKSTVLRLLLGLLRPDAGQVLYAGRPVDQQNPRQLRQQFGYVIQDGGLFPHLTARANVTLLARLLKWDGERIDRRIRELADLTHFPTDGLDRFPAQLSGGQRQRVSLMRALMLDPDVMLLDEPLGALDPMIRSELQQDLRDIFRALRKTVLLVTHDLHEATFFADEMILLREGQMTQRGTIRELTNSPANAFVTQFVNAQRSTIRGDV